MMIKIKSKNKLLGVVLSGAILFSGIASADFLDCDPKFYMGAEAQGQQYGGGAKELTVQQGANRFLVATPDKKAFFGKGGAGLTGFIGTRLNPYLGLELGYTALSSLKRTYINPLLTSDATAKGSNGYFDALGYLPISDCLEGIGSLGVGVLSTKITGSVRGTPCGLLSGVDLDKVSQTKTKAGVRLGLGLGYKINENLGARFMLRHQQGNQHIKSINSAAIGLSYQF